MKGQQEDICVVDRYFYQSYKKMEERKLSSLSFYLVRTLALLLALPINYLFLEQLKYQIISPFTAFLAVAFTSTLIFTLFSCFFYYSYVRSPIRILKIASNFHHTFIPNDPKGQFGNQMEEEINLYEKDQSLGLLVSTTYYDFQNMQKINQVSEQFKTIRQSNGSNLIKNALQANLDCFKLLDYGFMSVSVFVFAFGVAIAVMAPLSQAQHSLLQMVLVSEVMLQPKVYAIILVIFFSPIIILGICLYCCCCANSQQRAQLPASTKVSPEIMSKCADCCICFQPFWVDDEVAVLPCSDMHVFHYSCMEGWSKVKPNCPICRHLLL